LFLILVIPLSFCLLLQVLFLLVVHGFTPKERSELLN